MNSNKEDTEFRETLQDAHKIIKKYFTGTKCCLAYNKTACKGEIICAHTISKKYIKKLITNGHVYMPKFSLFNDREPYRYIKVGINNATTFNGFCKFHDNFLFRAFEKNNFNCTSEQVYQCSFRSFCREHYQKECAFKYLEDIKSQKIQLQNPQLLDSEHFNTAYEHAKNEFIAHKKIYRKLKNKRLNLYPYLCFNCTRLPIATTGILYPLLDCNGYKLQSEGDEQHGFIYSIFPVVDSSWIILYTFRSKRKVHEMYFSSLKGQDNFTTLINYILTYTFFNNDNIVIAPSWFEQLDKNFKTQLIHLMNIQVGNYSHVNSSDIIKFSSYLPALNLFKMKDRF